MKLNDDQLAIILQGTRDFAKDILEELGLFTPFGARGFPDGTLEFFASPPKQELTPIDQLYGEVRTALVESARAGEILAGVVVANVVLPEDIASPFRNAIGMQIEARGYSRYVYATYQLSPPKTESAQASVELGKMFPMDVAPEIFAQ